MELDPYVREVLGSYLLGKIEPNPLTFTSRHLQDLPLLRRAIEQAKNGKMIMFRTPVIRKSLLLACREQTQGESREHLIVGYGRKYGSTTKIEAIHHVLGLEHEVAPTPAVRAAMQKYMRQVPGGEVIVFHNHPPNFLNILIDNLPWPSPDDRRFATNLKFNVFQFIKTLFGTGEIMLYLGENGFVKEFQLPTLSQIIEFRRWCSANNQNIDVDALGRRILQEVMMS